MVGDETVTAVFHGDTWWSWCPSRDGLTNGGRPNEYHGRGPAELDGKPFRVLEITELRVDNDLPPETFNPQTLDGGTFANV